uniref:Toxin of the ChpA-ChpR toxin-antitoxin system,endoribonuclease n=1 Tax=mine drainage metagenome TaxID=410659 RepID=E6Q6J3_9ZZZZ
MNDDAPDEGDVIWLTLDPTLGHEQQGRRPFLVLTPRGYNQKTSLVLGCPITSKSKGYPFEVRVSGVDALAGVALADQLKSLDWRVRRAEIAGRVDVATTDAVRSLVKRLLAIR